jgi:hypothetical protein
MQGSLYCPVSRITGNLGTGTNMSGLRVNRDLVPSNLKSQRRVGDCVRSIRLLGFGLEGAFHRRWNGWSELNLEHHSIVLV